MRADDPLPDLNEKPGECECCQAPKVELKFYEAPPFTKRIAGDKGNWLCILCASTMAGNAHDYPEQYRDGRSGDVMKTMCFVGNAVIAAGRTPAQETLLRLLSDAKRMAEFGDINEDMEDDGVGWKAWYKEVSAVLKEANHQ